jgi:hypothetical protein
MKKVILFLCFVGSLGYSVNAQTTFTASATFKDSTCMENKAIPIEARIKQINCIFNGELVTGSLSISLKDPEGRHQAGFMLDAKTGKKSITLERVQQVLIKLNATTFSWLALI